MTLPAHPLRLLLREIYTRNVSNECNLKLSEVPFEREPEDVNDPIFNFYQHPAKDYIPMTLIDFSVDPNSSKLQNSSRQTTKTYHPR